MRIIRLSQQNDREAWLQLRLGKITGKKSKGIKPLSRGADRTPAGFWILLAEKLAVGSDGEPDMDRGTRLEKVALPLIAQRYGLDLDVDPGMWISEDNEDIALSPDGAEIGDKPTYAAEVKCLSSSNHLKYVVTALRNPEKRPIDLVPNDAQSAYKDQVIQYFVVNPDLQTLFFGLYDDRIVLDHLMLHVLIIERATIEEEIEKQKAIELGVLDDVNKLIEELRGF